ncbi:MAG TPA: substrate-binding domain-containing protein [Allosphingosinicella sp.]|nr:substrate-binding domain-containing protein [Allosphingosinicella sp.]
MRCLASLGLAVLLAACGSRQELRVCADPNNLPFSNSAGQGFENKLVELVAADLGAELSYTWWAQRRGNVRETLKAGRCDVIPGVGAGLEMLATTRPYYNSTYVAVTRADRDLVIASFDDPRLRNLRIGVQMIGDDFANTPPAHALVARGLTANVRGYMVYGDYGRPEPQSEIVRAVAAGEVDVAFVWGPVAGYFARRQTVPLRLTPLAPVDRRAEMPMAYAVAMGVRRDDSRLKSRLERSLERRAPEIARLLTSYAVPRVRSAPPPVEDDDQP